MDAKIFRTGEENYNTYGYHMRILRYITRREIIVIFDDGTTKKTDYKSFCLGKVKKPNGSTTYGVGILNEHYNSVLNPRIYKTWSSMLERCYDEKSKIKRPTYKDSICSENWLYFENFYKWCISQENYEAVKDTSWCLDKDILIKGNKIYSSNTACIVPQNVNKLFLKHDSAHGKYPIGVSYHNKNKKNPYIARCNNPFGKNYYHGFSTIIDAFNAYKEEKEKIIKQVAEDEYSKGTITKKCYEAMMKYEVEITD